MRFNTRLLGLASFAVDQVAVGEQQQYVGFRIGEGADDMNAVAVAGVEQFFDVVIRQGADLIDGPVDGDFRIAAQQAGKRQQELAPESGRPCRGWRIPAAGGRF